MKMKQLLLVGTIFFLVGCDDSLSTDMMQESSLQATQNIEENSTDKDRFVKSKDVNLSSPIAFSKDAFNQYSIFPGHTLGSWGNTGAFVALQESGEVVSWGEPLSGGDTTSLQDKLKEVDKIYSNAYAFAALKKDATVVTWGRDIYGGDSSAVESNLKDVVSIFSTKSAFAALRKDGSVVSWGGLVSGGDSSKVASKLYDVSTIFSTECAFAALKKDASVVTWGNSECGGDSFELEQRLKNVVVIYSNAKSFVALKADGDIVVWGNSEFGANASEIEKSVHNVVQIYSNRDSFVAITKDAEAFVWGGSSPNLYKFSDVKGVVSSWYGFALIKNDNSALFLSNDKSKSNIIGNVLSIAANANSFLISTLDNRVLAISNSSNEAIELPIKADEIKNIASNNHAFAILKEDKSVFAWGYEEAGGEIDKELEEKLQDVVSIASTGGKELYSTGAFAALKEDGSVVTWGAKSYGGDSSAVQDKLQNIVYISSYNK